MELLLLLLLLMPQVHSEDEDDDDEELLLLLDRRQGVDELEVESQRGKCEVEGVDESQECELLLESCTGQYRYSVLLEEEDDSDEEIPKRSYVRRFPQ